MKRKNFSNLAAAKFGSGSGSGSGWSENCGVYVNWLFPMRRQAG
jgi:hypothetical protein